MTPKNKKTNRKKSSKIKLLKNLFLIGLFFFFIFGGVFIIWATTIDLPDLNTFNERLVSQSTKIYDRTGEILLYDVYGEHKRTVISLDEISPYLQQATIAVEDQDFYKHNGIQISSIFRAVINNIKKGDLLSGQGGSTITQQVIKNALLNRDKKISRKLKEWILAPRLEKVLTKEDILGIYLNEIPYGGSVYGIQEAARRFFGKDAKDLDLIESAYLAGLPQAPTYYSPYGNNLEALESRKNYVLDRMYDSGFINEKERDSAKRVTTQFEKQQEFGIKAPHFVMYVKEILEKEYGKELVEQGGLKVITSLDWDLQQKGEEIVKRKALENKEKFDAENAALIATDPKNGEILTMVGSRDYFDKEIDGNFNIATTNRQPGSTFKPIVYAEAFNKGYRPETVVFDLETEFSAVCEAGGDCYNPVNYDDKFRGPISFREALAQSINIPAIKALYLAGLKDSLNLAKNMGLETLTNIQQYGLTLVLGGGEVRPIDMSKAYGVFASEGIRRELQSILEIQDSKGNVIFKNQIKEERVLSRQTSRLISDILSDNNARIPAYGSNSPLYFEDHDVAAKTGTTNDYKDAWTIGYTPDIVVVSWAGNNSNKSMDKQVAGYIITPLWNEFMKYTLEKFNHGSFNNPDPIDPTIKPILAGYWKGEETSVADSSTGKIANESTKEEDKKIIVTGGSGEIHSILYWVDTDNPLGPKPTNPNIDPQYKLWESAVSRWVRNNRISNKIETTNPRDVLQTKLTINSPLQDQSFKNDDILIVKPSLNNRDIRSGEVFINDSKVGDLGSVNKQMYFYPYEIDSIKDDNVMRIKIIDETGSEYEENVRFFVETETLE